MAFIRTFQAPGRARAWLAAWAAAALLALALVAPVLAARGPVRLTDPSVSPTEAPAGSQVTFSVTYSNGQGNAPQAIDVLVGDAVYPMSPLPSPGNYGSGIPYQAVVTPPAGTWSIEFVATDKFGNTASLSGGTLTVTAPPPPPPPPSSGGSAGGSGSSGGSSVGGSTVGSAASSSSGSSGGASVSGSSGASGPGGGAGAGSPGSDSAAGGSLAPDAVTDEPAFSAARVGAAGHGALAEAAGASPVGGASDGDDPALVAVPGGSSLGANGGDYVVRPRIPGMAAPAVAPAGLLGLLGGSSGFGTLAPTVIATFGGFAMAMSFMLFGKRRREGDPTDTDEALAEAAGIGSGAIASGALLGDPGTVAPPMLDGEAAMPRWRRPSLLAARKEDPLRTVRQDVKLTFDHGSVGPVDDRERRQIRYRVVRLLDSPDELVAGEIGVLDEGDEVQLLERSGAYWFVLCPDGRQGWVHRMVLGDVISDEEVPGPGARATSERLTGEPGLAARFIAPDRAGPEAPPLGLGVPPAWSLRTASATDAGVDIDEDVLRAYLAARARG